MPPKNVKDCAGGRFPTKYHNVYQKAAFSSGVWLGLKFCHLWLFFGQEALTLVSPPCTSKLFSLKLTNFVNNRLAQAAEEPADVLVMPERFRHALVMLLTPEGFRHAFRSHHSRTQRSRCHYGCIDTSSWFCNWHQYLPRGDFIDTHAQTLVWMKP